MFTEFLPSGSGSGLASCTTCEAEPKPDIIVSEVRITRRFFFFGGGSGVHWNHTKCVCNVLWKLEPQLATWILTKVKAAKDKHVLLQLWIISVCDSGIFLFQIGCSCSKQPVLTSHNIIMFTENWPEFWAPISSE